MSLFDTDEKSDQIASRIAELVETLNRCNERYRKGMPSGMNDAQFDRELRELKILEEEHPQYVLPESPTLRIGGEPPSGWPRVKHETPMLSIENVFSIEDLKNRLGKTEDTLRKKGYGPAYWVIERKVDGCALELSYENGKLIQALTRGEAGAGDNILENVKTIPDIPLVLTTAELAGLPKLEIRGEVYMKNSAFEAWNKTAVKKAANPRNATAGAIRRLDTKQCARTPLSFIAHSIARQTTLPSEVLTQQAFNSLMIEAGFTTALIPSKESTFRLFTGFQVLEFCRMVYEKGRRDLIDGHDFETDGLVIKLNYFAERDILGATSREPRWAFALKMEEYKAVTTLEDVLFEVGKTGAITPRAQYKPCRIAGTEVTYSTLSNLDIITELGIAIGDEVEIEKSGKIIPNIVRLVKKGENRKKILPPKCCPACNRPVVIENERDEEVKTLLPVQGKGRTGKRRVIRCVNPDCVGMLKRQIEFYGSREAVDISGLGPNIVGLLVDHGLVRDIADLYVLTAKQLASLPTVGTKTAENLYRAIRDRKSPPLKNFIRGLPIFFVGDGTSKRLAAHFKTFDAVVNASYEQLESVDDIGEFTATSIYQYFNSERWKNLMKKLQDNNVRPEGKKEEPAETSGAKPLAGLTVVVTGKLEKFDRHAVNDAIEFYGGKAGSGVTGKTDLLVKGDRPGQNKITLAEKHKIHVIEEPEFYAMIGLT